VHAHFACVVCVPAVDVGGILRRQKHYSIITHEASSPLRSPLIPFCFLLLYTQFPPRAWRQPEGSKKREKKKKRERERERERKTDPTNEGIRLSILSILSRVRSGSLIFLRSLFADSQRQRRPNKTRAEQNNLAQQIKRNKVNGVNLHSADK